MSNFLFRDDKGRVLTKRIAQTDCRSTVAWMDLMLPNLDLLDNIVGSGGITPTSANLDLVYDQRRISPQELFDTFYHWARGQNLKPLQYVLKRGKFVYFKCPITGRPDCGWVQVNFYPVSNVEFSRAMMRMNAESNYKCKERNILINSILYTSGLKMNPMAGVCDLKTEKMVSQDPNWIAVKLFGSRGVTKDLTTVERMLELMSKDVDRTRKLKVFLKHLEKEGIPFVDNYYEPEVNFLARLRDRIVNKGLTPIFESNARIEHLEDMVFERGSKGVRDALAIIQHSAKNTKQSVSTKWDGKPAIIWGRKPNGEFVLTDKSGFTAKGYDGRATSVEQLADIMNARGPGREDLIGIYAKLFPLLEQATPPNFKGYVKGDLLYSDTPPEVAGAYVFKPNFIEYKIPVTSKLGQKIGQSEVGIAVHTRIKDGEEQAVSHLRLNPVAGLLLIEPSDVSVSEFQLNQELVSEIMGVVQQHGANIDHLFSPSELRAQKITDLPQLCKRFINSRINSNFDNLLHGFLTWLETNVTPNKNANIREYLQSPQNQDGISSAFTVFLLLHELKMDTLTQLDRAEPGHEGWVAATPTGRAKLVNRFGFSAGNRAMNSPKD